MIRARITRCIDLYVKEISTSDALDKIDRSSIFIQCINQDSRYSSLNQSRFPIFEFELIMNIDLYALNFDSDPYPHTS
jgi:hypothetical protein